MPIYRTLGYGYAPIFGNALTKLPKKTSIDKNNKLNSSKSTT
jgi:hypothetical protein